MSTAQSLSGQCLCGTVKISGEFKAAHVGACHCDMCRRWAGGPFMVVESAGELQLDGGAAIGRYASSDWAERGFCNNCGSVLFYRLTGNNTHFVSTGLFADQSNLALDHQTFIDEKPPWYSFANKTRDLTGEELFAAFAPPE